MSDNAYRPRSADLGSLPLFVPPPAPMAQAPRLARDEPPRATARQRTRWNTQDEAYAAAPTGIAALVLASLRDDGPATCDELEQRLELTHQTCSASVNALMRRGAIIASGSRLTRSGRRARVWEPTR